MSEKLDLAILNEEYRDDPVYTQKVKVSEQETYCYLLILEATRSSRGCTWKSVHLQDYDNYDEKIKIKTKHNLPYFCLAKQTYLYLPASGFYSIRDKRLVPQLVQSAFRAVPVYVHPISHHAARDIMSRNIRDVEVMESISHLLCEVKNS